MDEFLILQGAKRMASFISASFLAVHVCLIYLFWRWGVTPMVYFNMGSIVFYLLSFILVAKGLLGAYTGLVYLEVVAHMAFATYYTGWENDFQFAIIGMSTLVFFAEYLCRSLRIPHTNATPLCIAGTVLYLGLSVICRVRPPDYQLPEEASFWLRLYWGAIVGIIMIMVLQVFMTRASRSEQVLQSRLSHDKLTGLPNRYFVAEYLSRLQREGNMGDYWIAVADIDDFKRVNDTYGHNAGDLVLETIASLLREASTPDMTACRWGGEEFLLVGRLRTDMDEVVERLERLRATVAGHSVWHEEDRISVTITIGTAAYQEGQTTTEWINSADERLYYGKANGKNQVAC